MESDELAARTESPVTGPTIAVENARVLFQIRPIIVYWRTGRKLIVSSESKLRMREMTCPGISLPLLSQPCSQLRW